MSEKILIKKPKFTQEGSGTIKLKNVDAVTMELEDYLEQLRVKFPNELPTRLVPSEQVAREIGQQDVIRYLENLIQRGE